MVKELVYLGTPYSGIKEDKAFRAEVVDMISKDMANKGLMVYSPISSWHNIAIKYNLPSDFKFWLDMCESFLSKCGKIVVIQLPGWEKSIGLTHEIEFAKKHGLEIEYLDPAPYIQHFCSKKNTSHYIKEYLSWVPED